MKTDKNKRDQTTHLLKRLDIYNDIKLDSRKVSNHVDKLLRDFVRKPFGMESERINKKVVWSFGNESEVTLEKLSASRVASIIIKYRNSIKSLGAVHSNFEKSLQEAREMLQKFELPEDEYKGLKPSIKTENLEDRISTLSKKYRNAKSHKNSAKIRAVVNSIEIYHPLFYKLSSPLYCAKSIANDKNTLALKEKHDMKIKVNTDYLYKKAISVLENSKSDWVDLVVSLCTLTGRRPTEIMKTAKFSECENKDMYVTFNGILKSRDRKLDSDFGDWDIPVFTEPKLIIKSLKTMRTKLVKMEKEKQNSGAAGGYWHGGYLTFTNRHGNEIKASIFDKRYINDIDHNEAINQQYNGTLNERIRKWLETGDFDIHSLRAIYTKSVYARESSTSPESYDSMTTRVLCYSKSSISGAVKHYAALEIDNTVDGIEVFKGGEKQELTSDSNDLLTTLNKADLIIERAGVKAKKLPIIHDWAKSRCENGMTLQDITTSYIRKHCKAGGKSVNADTAGLYLVLCNLVESLETQTMKYFKNPDNKWLVESKKTNVQKLLIKE